MLFSLSFWWSTLTKCHFALLEKGDVFYALLGLFASFSPWAKAVGQVGSGKGVGHESAMFTWLNRFNLYVHPCQGHLAGFIFVGLANGTCICPTQTNGPSKKGRRSSWIMKFHHQINSYCTILNGNHNKTLFGIDEFLVIYALQLLMVLWVFWRPGHLFLAGAKPLLEALLSSAQCHDWRHIFQGLDQATVRKWFEMIRHPIALVPFWKSNEKKVCSCWWLQVVDVPATWCLSLGCSCTFPRVLEDLRSFSRCVFVFCHTSPFRRYLCIYLQFQPSPWEIMTTTSKEATKAAWSISRRGQPAGSSSWGYISHRFQPLSEIHYDLCLDMWNDYCIY